MMELILYLQKSIFFGHHFTTIAGLGPIVGPAIGIIWGWLPAFIWVFFGSIFMGAVHDFTTLVISPRHQGKTIGDLTGDIISPNSLCFSVYYAIPAVYCLNGFCNDSRITFCNVS